MLSLKDVEADSNLRSLKRKLETIPEFEKTGPLDFDDPAVAVLAGRIVERQLVHSASGWRLTLPRNIVALWGISPGNNNVAVLISGGYIEVWSMEALKDSYSVSLMDLI